MTTDFIMRVNVRTTIMYGITVAGSVHASPWLRREHAAEMVCDPAGPGCLIECKHQKRRTRHVSSWPN